MMNIFPIRPALSAIAPGAMALILTLGLATPGWVRASAQLTQFIVEPTPAPPPPYAPPTVPPRAGLPGVQPQIGGITGNLDPTQQYGDLVRSQSTVGALDSSLLGESIDYDTGQTDFVANDVQIPGNFSLPFGVGRRYHVGNHNAGVLAGVFGDWDMEIPHVEGVVATSVGWTVTGSNSTQRCTDFGAPPAAVVTTPISGGTVTTTIPASEYNNGFTIVIPGSGRHEMLLRASDNTASPVGSHPVVTRDWWTASCTNQPNTNPNIPDEAFTVTSPNGVTYSFLQYSERSYPAYQRPADTTQSAMAVLPRSQVWFLPTHIEDRFGNWVNYTYTTENGQQMLSGLTSSDGRTMTISYFNNVVQTITDQGGRVWTYAYTSGSLSKVTLPDGSYWSINFSNLDNAGWTYSGATCTNLPTATYNSSLPGGVVSGTLQHPSGALGTFTFTVTRHGINNAPTACLQNSASVKFAAVLPSVFDVLSLTKKEITGPHLSTMDWTLAYAGCSGNTCTATKTTTVKDARGFNALYTFGAAYNSNADLDTEGQLQSLKTGGTGSTYLRTDAYTYFTASGHAYPSVSGTPAQVRGDVAALSTVRPMQTRTSTVDGATYIQTSSSPDAYGFPTTITRIGTATKTDALVFEHNPTAWIIGTLKSKTSNGVAEIFLTLNSNEVPSEIDRFGRKDKSFTYNNDGTVLTMSDGAGHTTAYASYSHGIPQTVTYDNNDTEHVTVNSYGVITSWNNGVDSTSYGHDAMGRVSSITPPAYSTTSITWGTSVSGWTRTETRGSYTKTDTLDGFLRSVSTTEPSSRTITRTFDADGHTLFESYPGLSSGITSTYDGLGRLTLQKDALNYSTTYTPGANSLAVEDRDGNTTTYSFKAYDEPTTKWPITIVAPLWTTTIARDTWGKPTTVTRGGVSRSYAYYATNQLLNTVTEPETGTTTFTYDGAANVKTLDRNGAGTETHTYDGRNRLTGISYSTGDPSVSFVWNADGLPASSSRGTNSRAFAYNSGRLLESETVTIGSVSYPLKYGYDTNGGVTSLTYPDNTSVTLGPDAYERPTQVGSIVTGISYFTNGAVHQFEYGNGIFHTTLQDSRQLPQESQDGTVLDWSYTYDGNSNPLTITDNIGTSVNTKAFTYDAANQLKTANASHLWGNTTYSYDALGNLTSDVTGSTTTTFTIDANNRASSVGALAVAYDTRGNVKQKGTGSSASTFTFNGANLLGGTAQNGATETYTYDAYGTRATTTSLSAIAAGSTVNSIYDHAGRLMYEATTASANPDQIFATGFEVIPPALTTTKYYYIGSHVVAKDTLNGTTDTLTYLHTEALGSPVFQTNGARVVTASSTYSPYGSLYAATGAGNQVGLGYAGQSTDANSMVYMRARYYDPQLHRFLSADSEGVDTNTALNFNRYSYAANSPYAKYDPSGRCTTDVPNPDGSAQDDGNTDCGSDPTPSSDFSSAITELNGAIMSIGPIGAEVVGAEEGVAATAGLATEAFEGASEGVGEAIGEVSNFISFAEVASIPKAIGGEDLLVLGQYAIAQGGRTLMGFAKSLQAQASALGGRTLASLPGNLESMIPQLEAANRIVFFTSGNMGSGLTAAEMAYIQSSAALRAKTIFVTGFYPPF